ncbi:MAG TPA: pyridoxamine 5'-phosphate oxidase family protein [Verrucomicrobiae bacterium]|nr:pyridoxamine 5'-phosphate oxidase family protein [Verrucomicrobiae bacterium]
MVGELSQAELEDVLREAIVGRIGCHAFGQTYVVPITYAYDGTNVFAHGHEGMKLHMMRQNPHVCFEVDFMDDLANWRSVIAWGTFAELHGAQREAALQLLLETMASRLPKGPPGESVHPHTGMATSVIYRIALEKKTGRFERRL